MRRIAVVLLVAAVGCAPRPRSASEYFPLAVGHDWLYRVQGLDGGERLLQFQIRSEGVGDRGETRYFLDDTGERYYLRHGNVIAYSITPDIWTVFLSGPLRPGRKFDGALAVVEDFTERPEGAPSPTPSVGRPVMQTVKSSGYKLVTATNRKISVPAGEFADCLEVTHSAGRTTGVKYFAPGIGLVFAEAWFEDARTKTRSVITRQELVGYHVGSRTGGDLNLPAETLTLTTSASTP